MPRTIPSVTSIGSTSGIPCPRGSCVTAGTPIPLAERGVRARHPVPAGARWKHHGEDHQRGHRSGPVESQRRRLRRPWHVHDDRDIGRLRRLHDTRPHERDLLRAHHELRRVPRPRLRGRLVQPFVRGDFRHSHLCHARLRNNRDRHRARERRVDRRRKVTSAEGGQVLSAVAVVAYDANGNQVRSSTTDSTGRYLVAGLPTGSFFLRTTNLAGWVDSLYRRDRLPGGGVRRHTRCAGGSDQGRSRLGDRLLARSRRQHRRDNPRRRGSRAAVAGHRDSLRRPGGTWQGETPTRSTPLAPT